MSTEGHPFSVLWADGSIYEARIPGTYRGTVSGYFSDPAALWTATADWDGRAQGIYMTLNPVNPNLLARSADRNYAVARFDDEYGELLFTRKYGPPWLYWYRRLSLLGRGLYYVRLCRDDKLSRKFWGKDPAVLRRVYRELVRLTLPIPGRRLAASSAPPAGFDRLTS